VIEVRDSESRQKILSSSGLREAGLIATVKEPRRPEVKVYDCPRDMSDAEIHRDVVELNLAQNADRWECDADSVTVAHRVLQRQGKLDTVFLNATPEARAKLLSIGQISVGWRSCRVADHAHVARCHRCQRLGHVQKFCREDRDVCVHCGGVGHKLASCKERDSPPKVCELPRQPARLVGAPGGLFRLSGSRQGTCLGDRSYAVRGCEWNR